MIQLSLCIAEEAEALRQRAFLFTFFAQEKSKCPPGMRANITTNEKRQKPYQYIKTYFRIVKFKQI